MKRITNQPAEVTEYVDKREKETAPLPYSLSALQIDAAKRFGMSAQSVLDTCQRLYETHRLILIHVLIVAICRKSILLNDIK